MADDCIFCKIVRGEIFCAELYSTDTVLAFLDIAPVNKGHALVLPKAHHETMFDVPADLWRDIMVAQQKVGRAIMQAAGAPGMNVMTNCYKVAGQLVPHAHWHLIPRHDGDGLELWPQAEYGDNEEMNHLAEAVRLAMK